MITKQANINGTVYNIKPKCEKSYAYTYYGKSTDVVQNADGSYSIPGITDANNADVFMAMDTGLVLMHDEEAGVWWKQSSYTKAAQ